MGYRDPVRVLIVEDEVRLAAQLAAALAEAGYAIDVANDGERADFLAHTERYDAAVLDLGLPKIDVASRCSGTGATRGWPFPCSC